VIELDGSLLTKPTPRYPPGGGQDGGPPSGGNVQECGSAENRRTSDTEVQEDLPTKIVVYDNGKLGFVDIEQKAFVAPEAVVGMAVYTARAMLHGKGHDVWEKTAPAPQLQYHADYYATWVLDPDGHDVEVVNKTGQVD
jgi:hypothetical protein